MTDPDDAIGSISLTPVRCKHIVLYIRYRIRHDCTRSCAEVHGISSSCNHGDSQRVNTHQSSENPIKATILKLIHDLPASAERSLIELNLIWQQVVGPGIACRTLLTGIGSDHLLIKTDSIELMNGLLGAHAYLLQRLRHFTVHARSVRALRFQVDPTLRAQTHAHQKQNEEPSMEDEWSDATIETITRIEDENLRESIMRAYRSYPRKRSNRVS